MTSCMVAVALDCYFYNDCNDLVNQSTEEEKDPVLMRSNDKKFDGFQDFLQKGRGVFSPLDFEMR